MSIIILTKSTSQKIILQQNKLNQTKNILLFYVIYIEGINYIIIIIITNS